MDFHTAKPFPIPVVSLLGPGSQDDDAPEYLPMPQGMSTYQPPPLPEPELLAAHQGCVDVLRAALAALRRPGAVEGTAIVELDSLGDEDCALLNQVLGEGEVAAQVLGSDGAPKPSQAMAAPRGGEPILGRPGDRLGVQVQESVFAGIWRVLYLEDGRPVRDTLEIGTVPQALIDAAREDAMRPRPGFAAAPEGVMNAPSLLTEVEDRQRGWHAGQPPHVINLTLLPLSPGDVAHLDEQLGAGRVLVLSRGYGNCRITNTRVPRTWRVTYFNSTDIVILDTLEISRMPDVACAAAEDLEDSAERLAEVLEWVQQA